MDILTTTQLDTAAELLTSGAVVAVPTPRWYMLAARAADPAAAATILRIKQRPEHKPLLLLLDALPTAQARFLFSRDACALAQHLWPGEVALRLPWRADAARLPAIGAPALVGCPDGILGQLLRLTGEPLSAAACSISTPAATADDHPALTADHVAAFNAQTGGHIAAVVDGGICPHGRHMTIVDCPHGQSARLHREGTVHPRAIAAALTEGASDVG
ncbi:MULTISPECIES: L-threonylcarbamoyladenylate synthase [Streptomyces]|uniref:L-threonylcarbamoyladenylate synthase n=1 Tax=Streptomyces TaxID=1883 RepID=UPI0029B47FE1|nr:Sua5/YciO/YrdC/YwlC family protein [Streptomyces scabiei]MDX2576701.1 Sua5/YciO/YrdC/YwlC family protein [Streptomyces scabiei]MDX3035107.1 Sua5/YciO/YrdC/YwlC family protein [Streptomyces scabiei]MDX3206284.1 Sua5/YciO/YrdC/YwlC family protein [Streptomyces scabiei]